MIKWPKKRTKIVCPGCKKTYYATLRKYIRVKWVVLGLFLAICAEIIAGIIERIILNGYG